MLFLWVCGVTQEQLIAQEPGPSLPKDLLPPREHAPRQPRTLEELSLDICTQDALGTLPGQLHPGLSRNSPWTSAGASLTGSGLHALAPRDTDTLECSSLRSKHQASAALLLEASAASHTPRLDSFRLTVRIWISEHFPSSKFQSTKFIFS